MVKQQIYFNFEEFVFYILKICFYLLMNARSFNMKNIGKILLAASLFATVACNKPAQETTKPETLSEQVTMVKNHLDEYSPTEISADMSHLSANEKILVQKLVEAGKLCDAIFWKQSAHDAIPTRDSLINFKTDESKIYLDYVNINYGPYDVLDENKRFVGDGSPTRPLGGGFYPLGMTKADFEAYVQKYPNEKESLESQYTVVVRDNDKLKAIPYHEYYPESKLLADKLDEAAEYADNATLKNYLKLRAKAIRTDDYYESDMAWLDIKNSNIDIVVGPIENYEDEIFNYKTAHEAVVMVKDIEASKDLDMYKAHIGDFQNKLPFDKKYLEPVKTDNEILQVVNVVYFGGDCQKGTKTIAAALPNDPKVHEAKGGKKSMYKNMMIAKFDKIVVPIANIILAPELRQYVDAKAFTGFVTLHEVSHTLGRGFVYGKKDLSVRKSLEERYSGIEETKADILSMYNHKTMLDMGLVKEDYIKKAIATYIAGLYRSLRFGTNSAHGTANLIQLNFLRENGGIIRNSDGTFTYEQDKFFNAVTELAKLILTTQAEGDYKKAGEIIDKYGKANAEINEGIEKLKSIPRDINTTYKF